MIRGLDTKIEYISQLKWDWLSRKAEGSSSTEMSKWKLYSYKLGML